MLGIRMPETCWAVFKRNAINLLLIVASSWLIQLNLNHSTCFGRSLRPSSGVQDCTYSISYMSYRLVDCILAGTRWKSFYLVPPSKQSTNLYDIQLVLSVQSWTPDDGRRDRPKHVEWYSINSKIVHLVGFTIEIYYDARPHERQSRPGGPWREQLVADH